jgi:hypothetical protein
MPHAFFRSKYALKIMKITYIQVRFVFKPYFATVSYEDILLPNTTGPVAEQAIADKHSSEVNAYHITQSFSTRGSPSFVQTAYMVFNIMPLYDEN